MKTIQPVMTALFVTTLISCSPVNYFQVFKAVPEGNTVLQDNALVYEDNNCIVTYNFWKKGGDIGFRIQNKTDQDIYLDLGESYFILNGVAQRYYQKRIFTTTPDKTLSRGRSSSGSSSETESTRREALPENRFSLSDLSSLIAHSGYTISFAEDELVVVPAKTSKNIWEFSVNQTLYRDCDLLRYPKSGKDIRTKRFSGTDSPFIFSNRIVYYTGKSSLPVNFENVFYVSEITNYNYNQMVEFKTEEFCGRKSSVRTLHYKHYSPDSFYLEYSKTSDPSRY